MKRLGIMIGTVLLCIGVVLFGLGKSAESFMKQDFSHTLVKELQNGEIIARSLDALAVDPSIRPPLEQALKAVFQDERIAARLETYTNQTIRSLITDEIVDLHLNEDIKALLLEQEDVIYLATQYVMSRAETHTWLSNLADVLDVEAAYEAQLLQIKTTMPASYQQAIRWIGFFYEGNVALLALVIGGIGSMLILIGTLSFYRWMKYGKTAFLLGALLLAGSGFIGEQALRLRYHDTLILDFAGTISEALFRCSAYAAGIGIVLWVLYGIIHLLVNKKDV